MYGKNPLSISTAIWGWSSLAKNSSLMVMLTSTVASFFLRQSKLRWKCILYVFFNSLFSRVKNFSKVWILLETTLLGYFLSSDEISCLQPWHLCICAVDGTITGAFLQKYLDWLPGLGGGGPNSGWASCMLLVSSMTSATSAMLATMASSSMQGAAPFFDIAFCLFFGADFFADTFFAGAFFGCTFFLFLFPNSVSSSSSSTFSTSLSLFSSTPYFNLFGSLCLHFLPGMNVAGSVASSASSLMALTLPSSYLYWKF